MIAATAELARFEVAFTGGRKADVHVFDLEKAPGIDAELELAEERTRSERFHKPVDAQRFLARRVILRHLIGERCGRDPRELVLTANKYGRPRIVGIEPLRFNTSHSREFYAVALVEGSDPGIDIEMLRDVPDAASLVRRIVAEGDDLEVIHAEVDSEHLLRIWTRKEAVLKATGIGLSLDPTRVGVPNSRSPRSSEVSVQVALDGTTHEFRLRDVVDPALPEGLLMALALAPCE